MAGVDHKDPAAAQVFPGGAGVVRDPDHRARRRDHAVALHADAAALMGLGGVVGDGAAGHFKGGRAAVVPPADANAAAGPCGGVVGDEGAAADGQLGVVDGLIAVLAVFVGDNGDPAAAIGAACDHGLACGGIVGDLAAGNGDGALAGGVNAAALRRGVPGDGAAGHGQRAVFHIDAAALRGGGIAPDGTALQAHFAAVYCHNGCGAVSPFDGPAAGAVPQGQAAAALHEKHRLISASLFEGVAVEVHGQGLCHQDLRRHGLVPGQLHGGSRRCGVGQAGIGRRLAVDDVGLLCCPRRGEQRGGQQQRRPDRQQSSFHHDISPFVSGFRPRRGPALGRIQRFIFLIS